MLFGNNQCLLPQVGLLLESLAGLASLNCPILGGTQSCHNSTAIPNMCCFNHPGGQLLLTQFWDTAPSTGPADSWTIHGLWPDNCDGSYEQYCAPEREFYNITEVLQERAPCTLNYMETYWKDYQGDDEDFWEHEFNKHGTCISTLDPKCYRHHKPGDEVVDFFVRAVQLFKTLPSYDWLAKAGIVPSTTKTYTLAEIQAALHSHHGHDVIINCNRNHELNELWYHYNAFGSVANGRFVAVEPVGSPSTCPTTGIKYLPKYQTLPPTSSTSAVPTSTSSAAPAPTGTQALSGKGYFYVQTGGAPAGFLISAGKWYNTGGTPATYTATPDADGLTFTLNSSKGKCGIQSDDSLLCADTVEVGSSFGWNGSYLTYSGSSSFYADAVPSGTAQGTIYTVEKPVTVQFTWSPR